MRLATYRVAQLIVTEHRFEFPLDHATQSGQQIEVFAREVVAGDKFERDLPWLVFFEGGPGHEGPRPLRRREPSWQDRALPDYRLLLLDQRGTGRSSPVDKVMGRPLEQVDFLTHFRADSIVKDAELIRQELGVKTWSVMGQSFGGFCVVSYLSMYPEGLVEAFITGGLPPLDRHIDEVYAATYQRVVDKTMRYYDRYPYDRKRVSSIINRLDREVVPLPSGDRLSSRRFRQLGHLLGMSDGFEKLHYIVELPFGSRGFLHDIERALPFARNPLYAIIHEACYASGSVTGWSAGRLLPPEFEDQTLLTGEHVFSWMFSEYASLRPYAEAANLLAEHPWETLYDVRQLADNRVPVAALILAEDMYVERSFSEETASRICSLRAWVTNEYEHDALRVDGAHVLDRLINLAHTN